MFCNQCGSQIPEGYAVCPLCNPNVAQPQPAQPPQAPPPGPYPPAGPSAYNAPPPPGGYPGPYGAPQPYYQPAATSSTNGFAIASLVCAFAGCLIGLPWVLGVIFGFVALSQIKASGGIQQGRGLAIAGIAVSGACMLLVFAYFVLMIILAATGNLPSGTG
jgi:hypothetical protein